MKYNNFISSLSNKIKSYLPGEAAQLEMAPRNRLVVSHIEEPVKSGVLILFYNKHEELYIPFIQRNQYSGPHSGQISFPGGKFENGDASIIKTALREASEEIGINPDAVQILGELTPLLIVVTNFKVFPVVGYSEELPDFITDKNEVQELLEIRLKDLLNEENISELIFERLGEQLKAPCYLINGHRIWGATAMILSELLELVRQIS
jgi:8-oxo-dGTP pyrophosphatase MutT (NUDIX family)